MSRPPDCGLTPLDPGWGARFIDSIRGPQGFDHLVRPIPRDTPPAMAAVGRRNANFAKKN